MNPGPMIRSTQALPALLAALALGACSHGSQGSLPPGVPAAIGIPGQGIFPESLTSTRDGSVIIGSIGTHQIFKAKPGAARAQAWIAPGTDGLQSVLGVFADEASGTLYACSDPVKPSGPPSPEPGSLYTFDLATGAPKGHYPFPTAGALCNDIAVGPDGTAYATDTTNMEVVRLRKGATALEVWAGPAGFGPRDGQLDGIAVLGHRVLAATLGSSRLFCVPIQADGSAGPIVEVKLDRPLEWPDGMRSFGPDTVLVVEGGAGGRVRDWLARFQGGPAGLSRITLHQDSGTVTSLRRGFRDGPVSVTVVGTTAYVLEGQLAGFFRSPGSPPRPLHPFQASAVEVGQPAVED